MPALVLTEQGATVAVEGDRFLVRKGAQLLRTVRAEETDRILAFGSIELTSATIRRALRQGCHVAFFDQHGRYRGCLRGPEARNVFARVRQIVRLQALEPRLELARAVVSGKLANQRVVLLRGRRTVDDPALSEAIARISLARNRLQSTADLDQVRGVEGMAAAAYFGVFGKLVRNPDIAFNGRTRRPPLDPVNATLGFGYALLASQVESHIHRVGLDPMVGALHDLAYGRHSLVLDLMEEWRPVLVDAVAIRLFNRKQLGPSDFHELLPDLTEMVLAGEEPPPPVPEGRRAVHLTATGRRILIREFLRRMKETITPTDSTAAMTFDAALSRQVLRFRGALEEGGSPYQAFTLR